MKFGNCNRRALLFQQPMPHIGCFYVLEEEERCCEGITRRCEFRYMELIALKTAKHFPFNLSICSITTSLGWRGILIRRHSNGKFYIIWDNFFKLLILCQTRLPRIILRPMNIITDDLRRAIIEQCRLCWYSAMWGKRGLKRTMPL